MNDFEEESLYVRSVIHNRLAAVWYSFEPHAVRSGWTSDLVQNALLNVVSSATAMTKLSEMPENERFKYFSVVAHNAVTTFLKKLFREAQNNKKYRLAVKTIQDDDFSGHKYLIDVSGSIHEADFMVASAILSGYTQAEVGEMFGMSQRQVRNRLSKLGRALYASQ